MAQNKRSNVLGLIPARGGSKGIPKKNLFPIMAKPLLQYTFEAAKDSCLTSVMISTEDEEIQHFARLHAVDSRYRRPAELGSDQASTLDVVKDVLAWLKKQNEWPDLLVLLQPTSPLRSSEDINRAIDVFQDKQLDSLVSVHRMTEHPYKSLSVDETGHWTYLARPEKEGVHRRQDYDAEFYTINGALYIVRPDWFEKTGLLVQEGVTHLFEMNPVAGLDVDELVDVFKVEAYLKMLAN